MVTDYRGHHRTLFPVGEIKLKACVLVISGWITRLDLGIEPETVHVQSPKAIVHSVKPPGQDIHGCHK